MKQFLYVIIFLFLSLTASAQVYKSVTVTTAGSLNTLLTVEEKTSVTNLTISGIIDARDIKYIRDEMTVLSVLNLSAVNIAGYSGNQGPYPTSWGSATYPANGMPQYSFYNNDTGLGKTLLTHVTLPSSLTSIGDLAFQYCKGITNCDIPNQVKTIGDNAFYECSSLSELIIPNSVTSIGRSAFQFCHGFKSVTLGNKVNTIGSQCFLQCDNLKIVYSNNPIPPALGGNAFYYSYLTMVFVPTGSVNSYKAASGWSAFNIGTNVLVTVNNATAGGLRNSLLAVIGNEPLSSITKLKVTGNLNSIDIKFMRDELTLLEVDLSGATLSGNALPAGAFQGKGILTSIKLPESLVSIGDNAFNSCANLACPVPILTNMTNLTYIGNSAFLNCKLMTGTLNFPVNLTTIGSSAFQGCTSLSGSITITEKVTTIGGSAFSGCTKLAGSLLLPNSVNSIGSYTFQDCRGLSGELVLPDKLTTIASGAFAGCTGFAGRLLIPSSVTTIEGSAFSGCNLLTEIILSKNTASIGGQAFYGCSGLTKIYVPTLAPPVISSSTFTYVDYKNCVLEVTANKSLYKTADFWKLFSTIEEISGTNSIAVDLGPNGSVKESNVSLANGSMLIVDRYSTKTFTIQPDVNYVVDTLLYNGADVKSQMINNQFTTSVITADNSLKARFKRVYRITVRTNSGGTVKENGVTLKNDTVLAALKDDVKTFTITPDAEYYLDSLYYGEVDVKSRIVNNQFTIQPVSADSVLNVVFKKITFDILINTGSGGVIKENNKELTNGSVLVADINTVKIFSILPSDGYVLDTLIYNGEDVRNYVINNQFTTSKVTADNTLKVRFKRIYRITIRTNTGGSVNVNNISLPNDTVLIANKDDVKIFAITSLADYYLDSLYYGGVDVKSQIINNQYTIPPISADATLNVVFKKITFNIHINTGLGGVVKDGNSILKNDSVLSVAKDEEKIFTILPSEGFVLDTLRFHGSDVKTQLQNNQYSTGPIIRNDTLKVRFVNSNDTFNIKVKTGENGIVKENNVILPNDTVLTVKINAVKTFTFVPASGYEIATLKFRGVDVSLPLTNNQFSTPLINENDTVSVTFKKIIYTITVETGAGGVVKENDVTIVNPVAAEFGTTKTFTFVPGTGYEIATIKYDGSDVLLPLLNNQFTTQPINANKTLIVTFKKITYTITVLTGAGGEVKDTNGTINGVVTVEAGTTKTFTFIPAAGYEIESVKYAGVSVLPLNNHQYTTPLINGNVTLEVTFRNMTYTITIEKGVEGAVKENNINLVNGSTITAVTGTTKTFTFIPAAGYEIATLTFAGSDVKSQVSNNQYTTPAISANATLNVTFKKTTYTISIVTGTGGEIKENNVSLNNGSVIIAESGTTKIFTFIPAEGYEIASLTYRGINVKSFINNNQYTTQAITANAILEVTFRLKSTTTFEIKIQVGTGGLVKENNLILPNDTLLIADKGSVKTFTFIPEPGNRVATLIYDKFPVTAAMSDNKYTIAPITYNTVLSVTFEPIPVSYTITIITDEGGIVKENEVPLANGSKIEADANTKKTFSFVPADGYEIAKLMFGGINYTSLIKNQFTTPVINANATLEVTFRLRTASPVIDISRVNVYANRSEIVVEGISKNEPISIYSVTGVMIYNQKSSGERTIIPARPNAVYLVKTAGKTYKVIL